MPAGETASETTPAAASNPRIVTQSDTANIKVFATKLPKNVIIDQKTVWTSPFHKQNVKWWLLFGGATAALVATDRQTRDALGNNPNQIRWGENISHLGSTLTLIPVVGGFTLPAWPGHDAKAREVGILGSETLLDGIIVYAVLSKAIGRKRPNSGNEQGEFFDGGASFPSGHSLEAWGLASLLAHEYHNVSWVPWLVYPVAGVVSASRFAARQHNLSDLIAGGAMGWFIGRYVYNSRSPEGVRIAGFRTSLTPIIQPASAATALV